MTHRILPVVLVALAFAASAEEKAPVVPRVELKKPFYYDEGGAGDTWGKAGYGLGLVFRIEGGKEVCHVLFFGKGLEITEKVLPVLRKDDAVTIGGVACKTKPLSDSLLLPGGRELHADAGAVVPGALKQAAACRYLLTEHLTAKDLAAAEAKAAPKTEAETWKRLCAQDYLVVPPAFDGPGKSLRFFEDKAGRKCRIVRYGVDAPIAGITEETVTLKGTEVAVGQEVFRLDPPSMSLTLEKPEKGLTAFPEDRSYLDGMLKAKDQGKP